MNGSFTKKQTVHCNTVHLTFNNFRILLFHFFHFSFISLAIYIVGKAYYKVMFRIIMEIFQNDYIRINGLFVKKSNKTSKLTYNLHQREIYIHNKWKKSNVGQH